MNSKSFTFDELVSNLENNINFSFSRFGDGEWNCIFLNPEQRAAKKANCDGHEYFLDLGDALRSIVVDGSPEYNVGLQNLGYRIWKEEIDKIADVSFSDSDILHKASINGILDKLFDSLKNRRTILVGPDYMASMDRINYTHHIIVPNKNCWNERDRIESSIKRLVEPNDVVLYMASMTSNVLIDSIYKAYGKSITQIDCGSVFDPYVGVKTRKYHDDIIKAKS